MRTQSGREDDNREKVSSFGRCAVDEGGAEQGRQQRRCHRATGRGAAATEPLGGGRPRCPLGREQLGRRRGSVGSLPGQKLDSPRRLFISESWRIPVRSAPEREQRLVPRSQHGDPGPGCPGAAEGGAALD